MSRLTREEKLSTYRRALLVLLREVRSGGKPAFGVCGSLDNVLRVQPEVQLNGYVFCHANAHAWPLAARTDTLAANGEFLADGYFILGEAPFEPLWEDEGRDKREQFMLWLICRIDRGEAFIDELEAEAAGWVSADSGEVHDEC